MASDPSLYRDQAQAFCPLLREIKKSTTNEFCCNVLDEVGNKLCHGLVGPGMDMLDLWLRLERSLHSKEDWSRLVTACRHHPVSTLVNADPFTSRAFLKPREYPGDAVIMDYIYSEEQVELRPRFDSLLAEQVFQHTIHLSGLASCSCAPTKDCCAH